MVELLTPGQDADQAQTINGTAEEIEPQASSGVTTTESTSAKDAIARISADVNCDPHIPLWVGNNLNASGCCN